MYGLGHRVVARHLDLRPVSARHERGALGERHEAVGVAARQGAHELVPKTVIIMIIMITIIIIMIIIIIIIMIMYSNT